MSQAEHWSIIQERGSLACMRLLLGSYRLLGRRFILIFLVPVVFYFYLSGHETRRASQLFLKRAHVVKANVPTGKRASFKHFMNFASAALDKIDAWLGKIDPAQIDYTNRELFESVSASKRGAVFIGSHLGNLEVCRALNASKYSTSINVVVFTQHAVKFNQILQKIHPGVAINLIEASHMGPHLMILLREKIDQGESLVIVGDRTSSTVSGRSSRVPFLNYPASFSHGPFILACLLECPVYLMFCVKEKGRHRVIFELFRQQLKLPRKNREQILDTTIADYANRLAHYAVEYPLQWFNFYDFWQRDELVTRSRNVEPPVK